jgi:hypothetical protein
MELVGEAATGYEALAAVERLKPKIKLLRTQDGRLEAELTGRYDGLVQLAGGEKLNNVVAGRGFEPLTFGL